MATNQHDALCVITIPRRPNLNVKAVIQQTTQWKISTPPEIQTIGKIKLCACKNFSTDKFIANANSWGSIHFKRTPDLVAMAVDCPNNLNIGSAKMHGIDKRTAVAESMTIDRCM